MNVCLRRRRRLKNRKRKADGRKGVKCVREWWADDSLPGELGTGNHLRSSTLRITEDASIGIIEEIAFWRGRSFQRLWRFRLWTPDIKNALMRIIELYLFSSGWLKINAAHFQQIANQHFLKNLLPRSELKKKLK